MDKYIEKAMAVRAAMRLSDDYAVARSEIDALPDVTLEEVHGRLICDPLTMDKPDAIGPEVRRKARMVLMEELEARDMICYEMRKGVLYASVRAAK